MLWSASPTTNTERPVIVILRILAIGHQQLDQVVLSTIGVLILIHKNDGNGASSCAPARFAVEAAPEEENVKVEHC